MILSMASRISDILHRIFRPGVSFPGARSVPMNDKGILVFSNTSEVIAAERLLKAAGIDVQVKGPPPDLRTGCDMVVVFPLIKQAAVESTLKTGNLQAEKLICQTDGLLDPVSLFQIKDLGEWLMVRAANMKITIERHSGTIVNVSGGGCPDVPWLAMQLIGKNLDEAPEPLKLGHTLCCYSLQKAFEEIKRIWQCG